MLRGGCCGILSSLHVLGLSMETCKAKKIQLQDVVIVVVFLKKKKKKVEMLRSRVQHISHRLCTLSSSEIQPK